MGCCSTGGNPGCRESHQHIGWHTEGCYCEKTQPIPCPTGVLQSSLQVSPLLFSDKEVWAMWLLQLEPPPPPPHLPQEVFSELDFLSDQVKVSRTSKISTGPIQVTRIGQAWTWDHSPQNRTKQERICLLQPACMQKSSVANAGNTEWYMADRKCQITVDFRYWGWRKSGPTHVAWVLVNSSQGMMSCERGNKL